MNMCTGGKSGAQKWKQEFFGLNKKNQRPNKNFEHEQLISQLEYYLA